jgi:activating signal cointegrator 1
MSDEMIPMQMKVMTLYQPWASLIASGLLRYETSKWKTNHRGRVAIHASEIWDDSLEKAWQQFRKIPETANLPAVAPRGAILCVCNLVDCVPVEQIRDQLTPLERELGDYSDGRYAWELKLVKVASEPIPIANKKGL